MKKMKKILSVFLIAAMVASLFVVVPVFAAEGDLVAAVNAATTVDEVKAALKTAIEGGTVVDTNYKKVEDDKFDDVLTALIGKDFADDAAVVTAFNAAVAENYNPAIAEIKSFDDPILGEFANQILTNGTYVTGTHEGYTGTYFKATSGTTPIELENVITGDKILDVYIDAYTEVYGKNDISTNVNARYDSHGLWISQSSTGVTGATSIKPYLIIGNSKSHTNGKNVLQQPDAGNSKTTITNPSWHTEDLELVFEGGLPVSQTLKVNGTAIQWQEGGKGNVDSDNDGTNDLAEALAADAYTYPYGLAVGNSQKLANLKYIIYNCNSYWSDDYSKSYVKDFNVTLYKSVAEAIATTDVTDSALSNAFALYKAKGVADIDACYEGTDCDREAAYAYLREYVAGNPSATASQIVTDLTEYAQGYTEGGGTFTLVGAVNAAKNAVQVKNALRTAIEGGTVLDANYKKVDDDKFENVLNALIDKDFADDAAVISAFSEAVNANYNRAIVEIHSFDDPILGEFANEILTNGTYVTGTHEGYTGKYFKATSGTTPIELESAITGDKYLNVYIDAYTEVYGKNDISTNTNARYDSHGLWISQSSTGVTGTVSIKPYLVLGNSKSHTNGKNILQQPDSGNSKTTITNPSWHTEKLNISFENGLPVSQTLKINDTAIEWQEGGKGVGDSDSDGTNDLAEALAADATTYPYGLAGTNGNSQKIEDLKYVIYNCNSNWNDDYSKSYVKDFEVTVYYPLYQMINEAQTAAEVEDLLNFYASKNVITLDIENAEAEIKYDDVYAALAQINNFQSEAEVQAKYDELCYENMDLPDYEVEIELCNSEGVKVYNYSADDTLVANLSFKNNTDTARDIAFIAAVYDENGVLTKVSMPNDPVTAQGGRQTTSASFNPELPEDVDGTYMRLYVIDSSTISPYCRYEEYKSVAKDYTPTLYLIGDSLCTEYDESWAPYQGWGHYIGSNLEGINVANYAASGWTTEDFVHPETRGLTSKPNTWEKVKVNIKPGDFVMVALGINDSSSSRNISEERYVENLEVMFQDTIAAGATPLYSTPTIPGGTDGSADGWIVNAQWAARGEVCRKYAEEKGATCIPLGATLTQVYEQMYQDYKTANPTATEVEARNYVRYYFHLYNTNLTAEEPFGWGMTAAQITAHPGSAINDGTDDGTHVNDRGAQKLAEIISGLIQESSCPLSEYVKAN